MEAGSPLPHSASVRNSSPSRILRDESLFILPGRQTGRGWRYRQPLATSSSVRVSSASPSRRRHCMRSHIHLDLLWLRFLALRYAQRQHAILIIGLDGLRIHRVRQRKAPAERAIGAFDAQIVVFVHLILKLAFAANREDVVLHTDVQVLRI